MTTPSRALALVAALLAASLSASAQDTTGGAGSTGPGAAQSEDATPEVPEPVVPMPPTPPTPEAQRPASPDPAVEDLGNGRFRVGRIEIDKPAQRFTLPGVVVRREPPLEFLAVTEGGFKAYEALLELKASAYEFNMACLLIGLVPGEGRAPDHHFDPAVVEGEPVDIRVSFDGNEPRQRIDAAELIRFGDKRLTPGQWVYTGSTFAPDGSYLAQLDGTLIGFVHDPSSIIEHATGLGLGNFGEVGPNFELVPAVGSSMTLEVELRQTPNQGTGR